MNESSIKEKICNLLESVVDKTENINKSNSNEYLIEIDIALEDLKLLYNEFYLLKRLTEMQIEEGTGQSANQLESTETANRTFPRKFVTPPPQPDKKEDTETRKDNKSDIPVEKPSYDENSYDEKPPHDEKNLNEPNNYEKTEKTSEDNQQKNTTDTSTSESNSDQAENEFVENISEKPDESTPSQPTKTNNKNKAVADVVGNNQNGTLGDKYKQEDTSLNVRLAKMKQEVDIGTKMQQKPINNLKDGIGVNEKFLFINELFDGDIEAYNEAVDELNSFDTLDDAFNYINQLNDKYSWDAHHSSDTIDKFAYLVQRRFMTN